MEESKDVKTIIFQASSSDDMIASIKTLSEAIKLREDTAHKLFFVPLMLNMYLLSMGCVDTDGKKHIIGNHEIIFLPTVREDTIARIEATKNVLYKKSCMCFVGESDKNQKKLNDIIDWVLEMKEDIDL